MKPDIVALRDLLYYDPETGIFRWISRPAHKIQIGDKAGQLGNGGYIRIGIFGKRYQAHVIAWAMMTGKWPNHHVDHKNRNRSDNRWDNLRAATALENSINASKRNDNKSGVTGVSLHKSGKWRAYIKQDGKQKHLGLFETKEAAIDARISAAQDAYGEFTPH